GMKRRTARLKNARSRSVRASQVLREARSRRRRGRDIGMKETVVAGSCARPDDHRDNGSVSAARGQPARAQLGASTRRSLLALRSGPSHAVAPTSASRRRSTVRRRSAVARANTSPVTTSGGSGRNDDHSSRNQSREARTAAWTASSVSSSAIQVSTSFPSSSRWEETKPGMPRRIGKNPFSVYLAACATVPSRTRYRLITPCMSPPRVSRTSASGTCRNSRALQSAPGQGSGRRALAGENRLLRMSYDKIVRNGLQGKGRAGGAMSAPPAGPRASAFDDDEVFRVGPEARGVRDLHGVPGELAVVVGRRLQGRRVLARHDAVFLVRLRQRQLGQVAPVGLGELARVQVPGRHERLAALPQDEQEAGAALLLNEALALELILGAYHVIDRVGDRGHVLQRVLQSQVFGGERLHLLVERVDGLLLIVDHALEVLHGRRQVVAQAVGDRVERLDARFALLEARLELTHAGRHVADLLDECVARGPQRRLAGDLELSRRNVDLRDLPAHLAHETRVFRHFLHEAIALARRLRQAVDARLNLR